MNRLDMLAKIQELADLPPLDYDQKRKEAAKELEIRVTTLDAAVKNFRSGRKLFEHSNEHPSSATQAERTEGSNGCSIEQLLEQARPVLEADDPLDPVRRALVDRGYAGDTRPAELIYLAVSSRLLPRPLNVQVLAPSAAGKNHLVDAALSLHPDEAYYKLSASSPRALVYTREEFRHRTVVLGELDSIPSEGPAASAIRSIVNDAYMSYETVEKDESNKLVTRKIIKMGPSGLITTGIRALDRQMATRCLTLTVPDTVEQTRAVMQVEAAEAEGEAPPHVDVAPFHALQRWLELAGEREVVVPFARELGDLIPATVVRIRRDFKQVITTIKVLALLSQYNRGRTSTRAIVADIEDYARARRLLAPLLDSVVADGITPAIRETVQAVGEGEEISLTDLSKRLELSKSTVSWRIKQAIGGGWLKNAETRKSYPARLTRGTPLPEARAALPEPDVLSMAFESRTDGSTENSNINERVGGEGFRSGSFEWTDDSGEHDQDGIDDEERLA